MWMCSATLPLHMKSYYLFTKIALNFIVEHKFCVVDSVYMFAYAHKWEFVAVYKRVSARRVYGRVTRALLFNLTRFITQCQYIWSQHWSRNVKWMRHSLIHSVHPLTKTYPHTHTSCFIHIHIIAFFLSICHMLLFMCDANMLRHKGMCVCASVSYMLLGSISNFYYHIKSVFMCHVIFHVFSLAFHSSQCHSVNYPKYSKSHVPWDIFRIICFMFLCFFPLRFISSSFVCSVVLLSWPYVGAYMNVYVCLCVWVCIWMFGWFFRKRWNGCTHQFLSQNAIAYLFCLAKYKFSSKRQLPLCMRRVHCTLYNTNEWTEQTQTPTSAPAAAHITECHIVMCLSFTRTRQVRIFGTRNCKTCQASDCSPHRELPLQSNNMQFLFHAPFFIRKLHVEFVNMIIKSDY